MLKWLRAIEIMWIVIAGVSLFQIVEILMGKGFEDPMRLLIFTGFLIFAIIMFVVRKKQRQQIEERERNKNQ